MKFKLLIFSILCISKIFSEENLTLLNCSGSAKTTLSTSLGEVIIGVELEAATADGAEEKLTQTANRILIFLKGFQEGIIDSTTFQITPEYSNANPPMIKAYRGKSEITLTLPKDKMGEVIQRSFKEGANRVGGITLKANESEVNLASQLAIQKACQQAIERANTALQALHLEIDSIQSIDIQVNPSQPQPWRHQAVSFATKSSGIELEGTQEVEAQVQLKIRFKPIL